VVRGREKAKEKRKCKNHGNVTRQSVNGGPVYCVSCGEKVENPK